MRTVFADTFFYLAVLNKDDGAHKEALGRAAAIEGRIVTTEWVLTEVADALAAPRDRQTFLRLLALLDSRPDVVVVPASSSLFRLGCLLYQKRPDKEWSLTDCISFEVMKQHNITEALTGDHHFEQAGFVALLK